MLSIESQRLPGVSQTTAGRTDKKICIVLVVDDLGYGGAERQVVELANSMDPRRFDVHVCTLSGHIPLGAMLTDAERRLHVIARKNRLDITVVPRLTRLLRNLNADIVHGYLFSAEIASRLAGRLAGTRLVLGSERNANGTIGRRHVLAYKLTGRCVDRIIANSYSGAEFNARVFGRLASDYRVVHNGVDVGRFKHADPTTLRACHRHVCQFQAAEEPCHAVSGIQAGSRFTLGRLAAPCRRAAGR